MDPIDELQASINDLKSKQKEDRKALDENLHVTYDSLKPSRLIKSAINEVIDSVETDGDDTGDISIGPLAGNLAKKIIVRGSNKPAIRIAGSIAEIAVTGFVVKNDEAIKDFGRLILKGIVKLRNSRRDSD